MSLYKRGKIWWYSFEFKGRRYQGSTNQTNINKAKLVEATERSNAGLEAHGILPPKTAPVFSVFFAKNGQFLEYVYRHARARRTAKFYADNTKRLLAFRPWKDRRLSDVDGELIQKYTEFRAKTVGIPSINAELATLRKALKLAEEWQLIKKAPKVSLLPAPKGREFVVSGELETAYLTAAAYPLKQAAILMLDLGLRPEECVRLRKEDVTETTVTVREGKSVNAARALPLTQRAIDAIELLCALWPDSEWLFPGRKGKHYTRGALDNVHGSLRRENEWPREFVLYSFRHTFGTRLAESGASPFHITSLMGHYDVRMSQRYVHSQPEGLALTMKRKEAMDKLLRGEAEVPTISTEDRPK